MEKETKHTPGEDEQNGPYIFTGGADRISSTVTFEKGHERSLILRKHLSEDRIDNQSIRYKVYDAMEDYKNYELTIPSTELSEMKAAYEKDANKLMAERDRFKNLCDEKDKVIEDYSCNLKPVNELKAEIEKHMRELSEMKKEREELRGSLKKIFGYMDSGVLIRDISKDHEPGWAMKMLPFQRDLKEAYDRINKTTNG